MASQLFGALLRAVCVAMVVLLPSLLLPQVPLATAHAMLVVALLSGFLVFLEYSGRYPSIVAFRFAPPVNRLRFAAFAAAVATLSFLLAGKNDIGAFGTVLTAFGQAMGRALDFPYSPVRLMLLALPPDADPAQIEQLRIAAGLCSALAMMMIGIFLFLVRAMNWPMAHGAFNVWLNLPLFDPTREGDVEERLRRDANVNIVLGILLPFLIPVAIRLTPNGAEAFLAADPQTLIWAITAWAFLPANLALRGIALLRVAELIAARRRRVCATAESLWQRA